MRVIYRDSADDDLEGIETYYISRSPNGLKAVLLDITSTIDIIKKYPDIGVKIFRSGQVRRLTTAKYGYCISYIPKADIIEIIGIFRYQDRDV